MREGGAPPHRGVLWRDVEGHEGYRVSDLGEVVNTKSGKVLKGFANR